MADRIAFTGVIPESLVWVLAATLIGLIVTMYLSWTAGRIDRMHARVDAARAALDAQRHRRSGVAIEIAVAGLLDPASAVLVADSAHRARAAAAGDEELAENDLTGALAASFDDASFDDAALDDAALDDAALDDAVLDDAVLDDAVLDDAVLDDAVLDHADVPARREDSKRQVEDAGAADGAGEDLLAELDEAIRRMQLARRFHNDAVRATRALRGHRVVRWLRLAGHAPMPRPIDFDDRTPPGLRR